MGVDGSLRSDNFKICEISVAYLVGPDELTEIMICGFNILVRVWKDPGDFYPHHTDAWFTARVWVRDFQLVLGGSCGETSLHCDV